MSHEKISFLHAVRLCFFAAFTPDRMVEEQAADDRRRKEFPQPPPESRPNVFIVRRAIWSSLFLVIASTLVGYFLGVAGSCFFGRISPDTVTVMQVTGAMVLLWGTLFIRGWEIQTTGGVTLTERINQWIYRSLYCIGTAAIVFSLAVATY